MLKNKFSLNVLMAAALATMAISAGAQNLNSPVRYSDGPASESNSFNTNVHSGDSESENMTSSVPATAFGQTPPAGIVDHAASADMHGDSENGSKRSQTPPEHNFDGPHSYETISTLDGRTIITNPPPIEGCNAGLRFYPYVGKYWCSSLVPPPGYLPPPPPPLTPSGYTSSGGGGGGAFGGALACNSSGCLMQDGSVRDTQGNTVGGFRLDQSGNIVATVGGVTATFDVGGGASVDNNGNYATTNRISGVVVTNNGGDPSADNVLQNNTITVTTNQGGTSVVAANGASLNTQTGVITAADGQVIGNGSITNTGINVNIVGDPGGAGISGGIQFGAATPGGGNAISNIGNFTGDAGAAINDATQTPVIDITGTVGLF